MAFETLFFDGSTQYGVDGSLIGNFTFARNVATLDPTGTDVAANTPRWGHAALIGAMDDATAVSGTTGSGGWESGQGGYDADGSTGLSCVQENGVMNVYRGTGDTVVNTFDSSTTTDILGGAISGRRFIMKAWAVWYGAIIAVLVEQDTTQSNASIGIAMAVSNDYGDSWDLVDGSRINNGSPNLNKSLGAAWMLSNPFPIAGAEQTECWVTFTDYATNDSVNADGGVAGLVKLTRSTSSSSDWSSAGCRELWSDYQSAGGYHTHSAVVTWTPSGYMDVLIFNGDNTNQHTVRIRVTDPDDYLNCTLTTCTGIGQWPTTNGYDAAQPAGGAPGPGGSAIAMSDLEQELVQQWRCPDATDEPPSMLSLFTPDGVTRFGYGGQLDGDSALFIQRNPVTGAYIAKAEYSSDGESRRLAYSPDGSQWTFIRAYEGMNGAYWHGGKIRMVEKTSTGGDRMYEMDAPSLNSRRPLLINPGVLNMVWDEDEKATQGGVYDEDAAGYGTRMKWDGSQWLYDEADNGHTVGEVVENQPPAPPGTQVYGHHIVRVGGSGSAGDNVRLGLTNRSETGHNTDTGHGCMVAYFIPAVPHSLRRGSAFQARGRDSSNITTSTRWHINQTEAWTKVVAYVPPLGSGDTDDDLDWLFNWDHTTNDSAFNFYVIPESFSNSSGGVPGYPTAPGVDNSSTHEVATVGSLSMGSEWTAMVLGHVPYAAAYCNNITADDASGTEDRILATLYEDANNYIEAIYDQDNQRVRVEVTVSGSIDTTLLLNNFYPRPGDHILLAISLESGGDVTATMLTPTKDTSDVLTATGTPTGTVPSPSEVRLSRRADGTVHEGAWLGVLVDSSTGMTASQQETSLEAAATYLADDPASADFQLTSGVSPDLVGIDWATGELIYRAGSTNDRFNRFAVR